ncbi:MAG TPA: hypothetical protein VGP43_12570 [Chitinophagaceae bacterium]|nr:hypothetical protein [Chitinophagaceae bacterium]
MKSIATSYLLQSKECILPGIGILQIRNVSAKTDIVNNQILPPASEILFKEDSNLKSPSLVKYIADTKHIGLIEAEDTLILFCNEWKEKMISGDKMNFETLGSLQKNAENKIIFERESSFNFLKPITVNIAYEPIKEPVIIKEEPVLLKTVDFKKEEEENVVLEKSYWGLWALILLAIASVMLFFHFKIHETGSVIGNQKHFTIDSATATYSIPKK